MKKYLKFFGASLSILTLLAMLLVIFLSTKPLSPEAESFFQRFTGLGDTNKVYSLDKVLGKKIKSLCLFQGNDSYPYIAYEAFMEHSKEHKIDIQIPKKNYHVIFLIEDNDGNYKTMYRFNPLRLSTGEFYWAYIKDKKGALKKYSCVEGDIFFEFEKDLSTSIVFYQ